MAEQMTSYVCFLINLDDSTDRLSAASARFAAADLPFQRLSAVDMRGKSPHDHSDYNDAAAIAYMGRSLSGGEIGCFLSHLRAAQAFLDSDAEFGVVFEDDMVIPEDMKSLLDQSIEYLKKTPLKWFLVNFGANRMKIYTPVHQINGVNAAYALCKAHYFPMTTGGLIWSREGAQLFLDEHSKIRMPVDNYMRHWLTRTNTGLAVWPSFVCDSGAESEIDTSEAKRKKLSRSALYGIRKQRRLLIDKVLATLNKIFD